jgi:hypothetical protein
MKPGDANTQKEKAVADAAMQLVSERRIQLCTLLKAKYGEERVPGCGAAALCALFTWRHADRVMWKKLFHTLALVIHPNKGGPCNREQQLLQEMRDMLLDLLPQPPVKEDSS